ncbi:MAG: hypothetical protein K2V38_29095 [Gemmataceae bacterium]|nr:hypothetical protein [Gemmataceae bacterium]
MNQHYQAVLARDGLPASVIDCLSGKIRGKVLQMDAPAKWYGFPPALVPIWSEEDGSNYLGYWRHWFLDRPGTFVEFEVRRYLPSTGQHMMRASEIARTAAQFFGCVAIKALYFADKVTPELRKFAERVGLADLTAYEAVAAKIRYEPLGFYALPGFDRDLPLASVSDVRTYTGAFPTSLPFGSQAWRQTCCSFELTEDALDEWPQGTDVPLWLSKGKKVKLFDTFLGAGDFARAWLTLNSNGWKISEAKDALARLAEAAGDEHFSLLAQAWAAVATDSVKGY